MNQAEVSKLVSKLRIQVPPRHRNLRNSKGPEGRLDKLRKTVTGLIKYERIELNANRADEARQYAERVRSENNKVPYFANLLTKYCYIPSLFYVSVNIRSNTSWRLSQTNNGYS